MTSLLFDTKGRSSKSKVYITASIGWLFIVIHFFIFVRTKTFYVLCLFVFYNIYNSFTVAYIDLKQYLILPEVLIQSTDRHFISICGSNLHIKAVMLAQLQHGSTRKT